MKISLKLILYSGNDIIILYTNQNFNKDNLYEH